jgi:hypothetical protein
MDSIKEVGNHLIKINNKDHQGQFNVKLGDYEKIHEWWIFSSS